MSKHTELTELKSSGEPTPEVWLKSKNEIDKSSIINSSEASDKGIDDLASVDTPNSVEPMPVTKEDVTPSQPVKQDIDAASTKSRESYYILEDVSKEGLKKYLREAMIVFNDRYDVKSESIDQEIELIPPSFDLCYSYCRYVVIASKMEKEIPIVALVYLERLLERTGILVNNLNWWRLILTTLCLASKIWDDDSLENEHFPKVMKDLTLKEINTFERVFLDLIGYDLVVWGAEYAKYYFILKTIAD